MTSHPNFAARLRALRALRDLQQAELAVLAKVRPRTLSNWEAGRTEPSATNIVNLCEALKVSADYLLGRVDAENGLPPGMVVIDLDAVEQASADPAGAWDIAFHLPRRSLLVTPAKAEEIKAEVEAKRRKKHR